MDWTARASLFLTLLATTAGSAVAQLPPQPSRSLQQAYFAWSEGRYGEALADYLRIATAARDSGLIEEIAVLTGELYEVDEVTTDGLDIVASPDGWYLGYVLEADDSRDTHIVRVTPGGDSPREHAVLPGGRFALGPGGLVAYRTPGDPNRLAGPVAGREAARLRQNNLEFRAAEMEIRWIEATTSELRVREIETGLERTVDLGGRIAVDWVFGDAGTLLVAARAQGDFGTTGIYRVSPDSRSMDEIEAPRGYKDDLVAVAGGRHLVYSIPAIDPAPQKPGAVRQETPGDGGIGVVDLVSGDGISFPGEAPTVSADGSTLAWILRPAEFVADRVRFPHGPGGELRVTSLARNGDPRTILASDRPMGRPALSPDGTAVTYAGMPDDDWEIFILPTEGPAVPQRVTDEIQHDQDPSFVSRGTVIAAKGEGRHRRSHLYDLASGKTLELFHNNTVRTIAPEYEWAVSPNADWVGVVAERDGDTVSPERGVYVVDLTRRVSKEKLIARLEAALASERGLEAVADRVFLEIADSVRPVTAMVSPARIHEYARSLDSFGSKFVTQPGNQAAIQYIVDRLREFGYDPELQPLQVRGVNSANVIATLPGHTDPAVTYVVASHFDSHQRGPGADDNSSGTTALLEVARALKNHPQRGTIQFAFFTGEEAGLVGSRHYVGQLRSQGVYLAGALNNDMVGWANDHRLDNTIRYSNEGIRDIQHAAAMTFSRLITYDARYYKSTDAHAFFESYGDIVGGIGSYPVLGNPHYHQATDRLQTINHDLVAEVARTTVATIMALATHPSRPRGLDWQRGVDGETRIRWNPMPERDVVRYRVRYRAGAAEGWSEDITTDTRIDLPALPDGAEVQVKAVSRDGLEGWSWATVTVGLVPGGTSGGDR